MKKNILILIVSLFAYISNAVQYVPSGQVTNDSTVPGTTVTDAMNYLFSLGGSGGKIKVSATDTNIDYIEPKIESGTGITVTKLNTGFSEKLRVSLYTSPTVSFTGGDVISEQGTSIVDPILVWTCSTQLLLTRQLICAPALLNISFGAGGGGSYTNIDTFTTQRTYTMTINDGRSTSSANKTYYFRWRKYLGMSNNSTSLSNSEILNLEDTPLSTSYVTSQTTYTPAGNQYIWFCYPSSFAGTPRFYIATFDVTGAMTATLTTQSVTNSAGGITTYKLYRSPERYTEPTLFEVR